MGLSWSKGPWGEFQDTETSGHTHGEGYGKEDTVGRVWNDCGVRQDVVKVCRSFRG